MKSAITRVNYKILRELLRLPQDVQILAVRPDPDNAGMCILDIQSEWLPAGDELVAEFGYEHTTLVKFKGWSKK